MQRMDTWACSAACSSPLRRLLAVPNYSGGGQDGDVFDFAAPTAFEPYAVEVDVGGFPSIGRLRQASVRPAIFWLNSLKIEGLTRVPQSASVMQR